MILECEMNIEQVACLAFASDLSYDGQYASMSAWDRCVWIIEKAQDLWAQEDSRHSAPSTETEVATDGESSSDDNITSSNSSVNTGQTPSIIKSTASSQLSSTTDTKPDDIGSPTDAWRSFLIEQEDTETQRLEVTPEWNLVRSTIFTHHDFQHTDETEIRI